MEARQELIVCVPGNYIHDFNKSSDIKNHFSLTGQRLCVSDKVNIPGPGTYEQQGYIYSKLAGVVNLVQKENVRNIV